MNTDETTVTAYEPGRAYALCTILSEQDCWALAVAGPHPLTAADRVDFARGYEEAKSC